MLSFDIVVGAMPVLGSFLGITWTPMAFYIAMAVVHAIAILLAFRLLQADPEHNTVIAAVLAAVLVNAVAYFLKDLGVLGILGSSATIFGLLAVISHGDMFKSAIVFMILVALYWAVAVFILPRQDDLYIEDIAGVAQVIMEGGLEAEPISTEEYERMRDGGD